MTTRQARTVSADPRTAVREIAEQLGPEPGAVVFYCSPDYDLDDLGAQLAQAFKCPVVGCTSAGHIGSQGFVRGGMIALGFDADYATLTPHLIHPLTSCMERSLEIAEAVRHCAHAGGSRFGLLLIDGLSKAEERVASALHQALGNVHLIGGSAADDLTFRRTCVYHSGRFHSDAAVYCHVETRKPVSFVKFQHFVGGDRKMVVTEADPVQRIIKEIDGLPAVEGYAEAIDANVADLDPAAFIQHPLVFKIGDQNFIRSIANIGPDGSLNCFCAVDTGMVLSVGRHLDALETMENAFAAVRSELRDPGVILGMDCILRRIEFEQNGTLDRVGAVLASNKVFGFSTYGEQYDAFHVNQTFTGVAIGA
jgi:hypothetical protein